MAIRRRLLAGALIRTPAHGLALVAAVAASLAACGPGGRTLHVAWTGGDTGRVTLPARARHCSGAPIELLAASGDTGVIVALYGGEPLQPGTYRVTEPTLAPTQRPAATLGARWLDSTTIAGYRGADGTVTLTETAPRLSGSFSARARLLDGSREITLTGEFRGIPVEPCPPGSLPDTAPGGV